MVITALIRAMTVGCALLVMPVSSAVAAVVDEYHNAAVVAATSIDTMPGLIEVIKEQRVVFVGETHSSVEDHMLQMHVLETMASQGEPLVLGVEWFQKPFQDVLDRYISGAIDERELLQKTEYYQRWGFDYRLYRPMMRFARKAGIRVLALNIEREITDNIMRHGIAGLSEIQHEKLPGDYDFNDSAYTRQLRSVFGEFDNEEHAVSEGFQRFLEVQITWDEVMAENAAAYLKGNPDSRMLVLVGRGHMHAGAMPKRLQRRVSLNALSIVNYSPDTPFNNADYLVFGQREALPPVGNIGISVSDRGQDEVLVKEISSNTRAKAVDIRSGDRILAINDTPVNSFSDMKYALMDSLPGDTVQLLLLRYANSAQERSLRVYLQLQE